ncbi:Sds3-like-domain-containing protein [Dipodascopsis uninucleata]
MASDKEKIKEENASTVDENPEEAETEIEGDFEDMEVDEDHTVASPKEPKKPNNNSMSSNEHKEDVIENTSENSAIESLVGTGTNEMELSRTGGKDEAHAEHTANGESEAKEEEDTESIKEVKSKLIHSAGRILDGDSTASDRRAESDSPAVRDSTEVIAHDVARTQSLSIHAARQSNKNEVEADAYTETDAHGDINEDADADVGAEGDDEEIVDADADEEGDADADADGEEELSTTKAKRKRDDDTDDEERTQKRKAAVLSLTEIEVEFAKLRDRLHEDKILRLQAEIDMCHDGTHPELAGVYGQISRTRDEKVRLADCQLKYRRRCIENQTKSFREHIHQQFLRNKAEFRSKMIRETTELWYRVNKERRQIDTLVPYYGYQITDKRSVLVRQRQAEYQEIAILSGIARYIGFPAAPEIKSATQDEIAEDLDALQAVPRMMYL